MGNRRIGARRVNALLRRGSEGTDTTYQAGLGITRAIVSHKIIKLGGMVETHILVDLQGDGGGAIWNGDADVEIIGEATDDDGTGAVADASLLTWENDVHGLFSEVEVHCVEAPAGGGLNIRLVNGGAQTLASGAASGVADDATTTGTNARYDLSNPDGDWAAGGVSHLGAPMANDADAVTDVDLYVGDTNKLYLSNGSAGVAAAYTAGKFLIILRGRDTSWGF
jgi:hypothetical protein